MEGNISYDKKVNKLSCSKKERKRNDALVQLRPYKVK